MFNFDLTKICIWIAALSQNMVKAETLSGYYQKVSYNNLTPYLSWGHLSVEYSFHNLPKISRRLECSRDLRCLFFVANSETCFIYGYSTVIRKEVYDTDDSDTAYIKKSIGACLEAWCYVYVSDGKNWQEASDYCNDMGGHLADVPDADTDEFLREVVFALDQTIWLGGTDIEEEGVWRWSNNNESFGFDAWEGTEPSNGDGIEDCSVMRIAPLTGIITWNDISCAFRKHFICNMQ